MGCRKEKKGGAKPKEVGSSSAEKITKAGGGRVARKNRDGKRTHLKQREKKH